MLAEYQPQEGDKAQKPSPMPDQHVAEGAIIASQQTQTIFDKAKGTLSPESANRFLPNNLSLGGIVETLEKRQDGQQLPEQTSTTTTDKPTTTKSAPEQSLLNRQERLFKELLNEAHGIDQSGDGFITLSELDRCINDSSVTGSKARAVAALKLIARSQSDNAEPKGVEIKDLQQLFALKTFLRENKYDGERFADLFQKYRDGKATEVDLNQLTSFANDFIVKSGGKPGENTAAEKFQEGIGKLIQDLRRLKELDWRLDKITTRSEALEHYGKSLYGASGKPAEGIKPEAVCQGLVGNCYFMAGVDSLAALDPPQVEKMIKQNNNGSFSVTFPGKQSIDLPMPTDTELLLYSGVTEHGIWPAVLEKAFGRFCKNNADFRKGKPRGATDQECSEGGGTTEGICILTGKNGVILSDLDRAGQERAWKEMQDNLNKKLPTIAGTGYSAASIFNKGENSGLESRHAYGVLKIDGNMITLRNPYGILATVTKDGLNRTGKMVGTFPMTKERFWKYFSEVELIDQR